MRRFPGLFPIILLAALAAGCGGREGAFEHFYSRPDLTPPAVVVTTPAHGTAPGYIFFAPKREVVQAGPMIVDDQGQLIWFNPLATHGVADFRVQLYQGRPVLTWWRGRATNGVGDGYDVIVDESYRQIGEVHAGNGLAADIHEFQITPRGTALITVYHRVPLDLTPVGGPKAGSVLEGVVQDLEVATGRVLFEWHSIDHIAIDESYIPPPPASRGAAASPYDYFHLNAVAQDTDGNLLISARNTHAIYKISRGTGTVLWRLGGKKSDFTMGAGTTFAWQHDVRRLPGGEISLFDNKANPPLAQESRGLVLRIDTRHRRVEVVRSYTHPAELLSGSQGNLQLLPDGHMLIGWGANPNFTEFDREGRVLFDAHFAQGADSYRAYRFVWSGHPRDRPALAVLTDRRGRVTAYASWNGATDVIRWRVLAGPDAHHLRQIITAQKSGFETAIDLGYLRDRYVTVQAQGPNGELVGISPAQKRPQR